MRLQLTLTVLALYITASYAASLPSTIRHRKRAEEACLGQPRLICVVHGTEGNKVEGIVRYKPVWMKSASGSYECNVRIRGYVKGLSPGKHGFHTHTYGDVSVPDGSSTGGHFSSPKEGDMPHALPSRAGRRHWGDFGNIVSDEYRMARYSRINKVITIAGVIGRGMTIHASKDKGYGFQPSGDAGARVANCVIGIANPEA